MFTIISVFWDYVLNISLLVALTSYSLRFSPSSLQPSPMFRLIILSSSLFISSLLYSLCLSVIVHFYTILCQLSSLHCIYLQFISYLFKSTCILFIYPFHLFEQFGSVTSILLFGQLDSVLFYIQSIFTARKFVFTQMSYGWR